MKPMKYEIMVRNTFGGCDRFNDPAKLANTDWYSDDTIDSAKTGTAYSIAHAAQYALSKNDTNLAARLNKLLKKTLSANKTTDLDKIVEEVLDAQRTLGIQSVQEGF